MIIKCPECQKEISDLAEKFAINAEKYLSKIL